MSEDTDKVTIEDATDEDDRDALQRALFQSQLEADLQGS